MAIAKVNLSDIEAFKSALMSKRNSIVDSSQILCNSISETLDSLDNDEKQIKELNSECEEAKQKKQREIDKTTNKVNNEKAKLSKIPPKIKIIRSDEKGNQTTEEKDNPKYTECLNQINELQIELQKLYDSLSKLDIALEEIQKQLQMVLDIKSNMNSILSDIKANLDTANSIISEGEAKIEKIHQIIDDYISVRIEPPLFDRDMTLPPIAKPNYEEKEQSYQDTATSGNGYSGGGALSGGGGSSSSNNDSTNNKEKRKNRFFPIIIPINKKNKKNELSKEEKFEQLFIDKEENNENEIDLLFKHVNENYTKDSLEWQEVARRQINNLIEKQKDLISKLDYLKKDEANHVDKMYDEHKIEEAMYNIRFNISDIEQYLSNKENILIGYTNTKNLINAYKPLIKKQDDQYTNFLGDCGIIACQNCLNILSKKLTSEKDTFNEFNCLRDEFNDSRLRENDYPYLSGKTSFNDRLAFLESKGKTLVKRNKQIEIDEILTNVKKGNPVMIYLCGQDLINQQLGSRYFTVNQHTIYSNKANHLINVVILTTDESGQCNGMYVNDIAGFTYSNIVYLTKEKFDKIKNNTRCFSVELCEVNK